MRKKTIVIGGSKGIGKAIADALETINFDVIATSRKNVDTSDLKSVKSFVRLHKETDILVLNTGGPPIRDFFDISEEEWIKYHNQLFLGFCLLLQNIKIRDDGYVFLISSDVIKEPKPGLILSSSYRLAFTSVLKALSKQFASRNISCINIAPGPIMTNRLKELIEDTEDFEKTLPMKRAGTSKEIGNFVKAIVANNIKYLSGVVISFDGSLGNYIL